MHKKILYLFFFIGFVGFGQQQLAEEYFKEGEYQKAIELYKKLYSRNKFSNTYLQRLIKSYQELEQYAKAEKIITNHLNDYPGQFQYWIDLGYNFQLQNDEKQAEKYYKKTIKLLENNPFSGFAIGQSFQSKHLLDYALLAYKKGLETNQNPNFYIKIAGIYGELGDFDNMFDTYLDLIEYQSRHLSTVQQYIGKFITSDPENNYNLILKKRILIRSQNNPDVLWNKMLSWLYTEQQEYNKAFIQEKAIHKRTPYNSLSRIFELGKITFENKEYSNSKTIFEFVTNTSKIENEVIDSKLYIILSDKALGVDNETTNKSFEQLIKDHGSKANTIDVQLAYAHFLAFDFKESQKAITLLKHLLNTDIKKLEIGKVKLELGDIYLLNNQFGNALINYTQVQTDIKNHPIAQEARFRVAKTSYYKGDFEWAETQLEVLKKSTSQLIANDALHLSLIISDNSLTDSIKTPLELYAKADLETFQNKKEQAIQTLDSLISQFPEHKIIDEALFKQAEIFESLKQYNLAINNYIQLIEINTDDILVDDAYYRLGEISLKIGDPEAAKNYYQKIIFDYPSSIHLVAARKKFRELRGDKI